MTDRIASYLLGIQPQKGLVLARCFGKLNAKWMYNLRDEKPMRCLHCDTDNPDGAKFCIECGTALRNRCPSCGFDNVARAKFCMECGTSLTPPQPLIPNPQPPAPNTYTPPHLAERIRAEQAALEARGAVDGERKTITALFADIKGSMDLIEDLDPEEARAIVDPALHLMMAAVHRYEGYVAQSMGDGIFALFGAPIAHEDHAQRALFAALRMQEEGKAYAERLRHDKGINLQMRVGVNTGEVVVRSIRKDDLHTDYVPVGHSTSLAARMEGLATPGSTVASAYTHQLTEGYFEFKDLGAAKIKGVTEPLQIYEVLGVGALRTRLQVSAARGLSRFVGRKKELDHLKQVRAQAINGQGQMVGVMGEPGVGKSRLFHEFKVLSEKHCLVLETFCAAHGSGYAYLPLIELLRNYFHIRPQDDERTLHEKVAGRVVALERALEDGLPYLLTLLGHSEFTAALQQMDPHIRQQRSFDTIKRLLVRESLTQPVVLIFEDLQWLDEGTQAFLDDLSESLATAQMVLLTNYRPEYRHAWGSKTYYSQLRLDALGMEEAKELLAVLLDEANWTVTAASLEPLKQLILEKTEGTPFFMEEMVRALFDQGVLVQGMGGIALTKSLDEIHIPATVQGVLAGRIDQLGAAEKELLQTAAVIGREFSLSLLTQVAHAAEEILVPLLSRLQTAEFIYEQPAFPEVEYTFKHALTQDVAYGSLVSERRREVHARTAQAIESLFHEQLNDRRLRELAYHSVHSGNAGKAVEYYQRAGEMALKHSAYTEAIRDLNHALDLLPTLSHTPDRPQQELTLLISLGSCLMATKGYAAPEVEIVYTRARELSRTIGDLPQKFPVLFGLWRFYLVRGEYAAAGEVIEKLQRLSECMPGSRQFLPAQQALGLTAFRLGEFADARVHLERAVAMYDPGVHGPENAQGVIGQDPGVASLAFLAWMLWHLGYPDQALQRSQEAIALAREISHPYSLVSALHFGTAVHRFRGEGAIAQTQAEGVVALASEQGFPYFQAAGTYLRGWAIAEQGQVEAGIVDMLEGRRIWQESGIRQLGQVSLLLAEAYRKVDRVKDGLAVLAEAEAEMDKSHEKWWQAELLRTRGELLLASQAGENSPEVTACFQRAIRTAHSQQAKSLELRTSICLATLWQEHGKPDDAYQLLSNIYGWFTEGFDTPDLWAAKELLDELAPVPA